MSRPLPLPSLAMLALLWLALIALPSQADEGRLFEDYDSFYSQLHTQPPPLTLLGPLSPPNGKHAVWTRDTPLGKLAIGSKGQYQLNRHALAISRLSVGGPQADLSKLDLATADVYQLGAQHICVESATSLLGASGSLQRWRYIVVLDDMGRDSFAVFSLFGSCHAISDLDGDGKLDLIVVSADGEYFQAQAKARHGGQLRTLALDAWQLIPEAPDNPYVFRASPLTDPFN
ncbi:hypothetical protein GCM10007907_40730 [Chitinimonas prasina]|uniref:VCBS repeat-containing protein n=1 Tax=Chitinimonas prasina TaxID=1434937 RepID=A0ABQ5YLH7_9NEIS|nr:hypothetical protein [Chitinimonas prasina]GLR15283.1 hypothetical protein GCM10007907_40730 [Chitinimonas prasina]